MHANKHQCWLYPKVVYVLYWIIGLLNSSNATTETPPRVLFYASSATSLLHASSFALILTFPKTFTMETLSICKKHPEALTSICSSVEKSNSSSLTHFHIKNLRISSHPLLYSPTNFILALIASAWTDLLYIGSTEMCVFHLTVSCKRVRVCVKVNPCFLQPLHIPTSI